VVRQPLLPASQSREARPRAPLPCPLVWGFFCQPLFLRFLVSIGFGLIATTGRTWWDQPQRSEGEPAYGRSIAPRTCMRLVQADQDHDAAMRISGEAPRRWAQSPIRHPCHVRGRVITTSVRRPPTAATLVGAETIGACLPQAAGRSTTPSSGSPLLTKRQSAINSFRARATIMVLRVAPRASAVRARYQRVSALSG
jgi:hypothetical protein